MRTMLLLILLACVGSAAEVIDLIGDRLPAEDKAAAQRTAIAFLDCAAAGDVDAAVAMVVPELQPAMREALVTMRYDLPDERIYGLDLDATGHVLVTIVNTSFGAETLRRDGRWLITSQALADKAADR